MIKFLELGRDNKKNILLVHGWGVDGSVLKSLGTRLQKLGWHVIIPDLPGFGGSPRPPIPLTVSGYATKIQELAGKEFKEQSYFAFGHSFGGRVVAKLTGKDKNVRGLILCAPGVSKYFVLTLSLYRILAKIFLLIPAIREYIFRSYYLSSNNLTRIIFRALRYEDPQTLFSKITVPVLILWGENDRVIPPQNAQAIKKFLPRAFVRTFPKIGHSMPYKRSAILAQEITIWANTFNREQTE